MDGIRPYEKIIILGERYYVSFALCRRKSVCCLIVVLSVVCLKRWCTVLKQLIFSAIFWHPI